MTGAFSFGFDFTMGAIAAILTVLIAGQTIKAVIRWSHLIRKQWRAKDLNTRFDPIEKVMIETIRPSHRWVRWFRKGKTRKVPC